VSLTNAVAPNQNCSEFPFALREPNAFVSVILASQSVVVAKQKHVAIVRQPIAAATSAICSLPFVVPAVAGSNHGNFA